MACVRHEFTIPLPPEAVWAAVRDVGAADRLFAGVLTAARLDGDGVRVVTFAGGAVVRELIVDVDDRGRRLAYTAVDGPLHAVHHHAVLQVLPHAAGSTVSWVTDVLPDELAAPVAALVHRGARAMHDSLTTAAPAPPPPDGAPAT